MFFVHDGYLTSERLSEVRSPSLHIVPQVCQVSILCHRLGERLSSGDGVEVGRVLGDLVELGSCELG